MTAPGSIVVVGAGAMGAATAWQLARRGAAVHVFERFEPGHARGASHGSSRNFNVAYDTPQHLGWLREAQTLWRELEAEAGTTLLERTGIVTHGAGRDLTALADAIRGGGFEAELIDATAAVRRWPGFRFDGPVVHTPQAGRLRADAAVQTLLRRSQAAGARVSHETRAIEIAPAGDAVRVTVEAADGARRVVAADRVVVTAGAWTQGLLPPSTGVRLPPLRVTQEQPAHFAPRDQRAEWPGFNHVPAPGDAATSWFPAGVYGMLSPGEGLKAGWHAAGPEIDPDRRSCTPDPVLTAQLVRYAREWLPGVDADRFVETTCTYTSTPDAAFVLRRFGPVVVGAGFSGHGFKFTPVVGRILADLALES